MPPSIADPQLVLLDRPHLRLGLTRHELPPNAPVAVLAFLGAQGDWVARERVMTLLWPDASEQAAQHHLRVTLHRARLIAAQWGFGERLQTERRRLRLDLPCDVVAFRQAVGRADWAQAVALHAAPLLSSFNVRGFAAFDEWASLEREALTATWRSAALRQAAALEGHGNASAAAALLQDQLHDELLAEDTLQALLRVAAAAGARDAALQAYERFCRRARDELGLDPLPGTQALAQSLRRAEPQRPAPVLVRTPGIVPSAVLQPPLVGRDAERVQLQQAGDGLTLVSGEPGVGKSRLVGEARPGALWLRCSEDRRAAPLQGIVDALQAVPPERRRASLPQANDRRDLAALLPDMAPGESTAGASTPTGRLIDVLATLLGGLADPGGLVVDDLQWADEGLLQVLHALLQRGQAVVATIRNQPLDEPLQHFIDQQDLLGRLRRCAIEPLPRSAMDELMRHLAGHEAPRFAQWLHGRSGGNPFFALETLRSLFETGLLGRSDAGWRSELDSLNADYHELPVPSRVKALVRLRVAALPETARRAMAVAALAGDAQHLELLAQVAGLSPWAMAEAVAAAQSTGLLRGREFAHDLLREALLAETPEPVQAVLHAGIARHAGAWLGPHRRAAHWWAAGDIDAALTASMQAFEHDRNLGLTEAAAGLLQRALPRCEQPSQRAQVLALQANLAVDVNRLDDAEHLAEQALQSLPHPMARASALAAQVMVALHRGAVQRARELALEAVRATPDDDDAQMLHARAAWAAGDLDAAVPIVQAMLDRHRRRPASHDLVDVLSSLASLYASRGRPDAALAAAQEAWSVADRLGARHAQVGSAGSLVYLLTRAGRLAEAIDVGERTLPMGDYDGTRYLRNSLVTAYFESGRLDDAERQCALLCDSGDPSMACTARAFLAEIQARRGDALATAAAVEQALRALDSTEFYGAQAIAITAVLRLGTDAQARRALVHWKDQPLLPHVRDKLDAALRERGLQPPG